MEWSAWAGAVPAFLLVLGLVLVPGAAMAYVVGMRGLLAWGLAPVLGFTALGLSPIAAHFLSVDWTPTLLVVSSLLWVVVAAVARLALRSWWQASGHGPPVPHGSSGRVDGRRTAAFAGGSVLLGCVLALAASLPAIGDPTELVDSTDVVAHLNRIRAFLDERSLSSIGAPSTYPSGFHDVAANAMLVLPGLDIVEAANLTALAAAAVFFPLGCVVLARVVLDCRPVVLLAAGLASASVTTFPFILMGWGVLWPNLMATALLPGVLAATLVAVGVARVDDGTGRRAVPVDRGTTALGVLGGLPGLALVHPNGLVSLVMFAVVGLVVVRVQASGVFALGDPARRTRPLVEGGALVAATLVVLLVLPRVSRQVADTMSYAPDTTTSVLPALKEVGLLSLEGTGVQLGVALLGIVGLVVCARRSELRWVVAVELLCLLLYVLAAGRRTAAGDLLTGYWYNDKYRLAALAAVPLMLQLVVATRAVADGARLVFLRFTPPDGQRRVVLLSSAVVALAVFVIVTGGLSHGQARRLVSEYYHPSYLDAVLLSPEQEAHLATLAAVIPPDAVTADVPSNGSALLYALDHRQVMFTSLLLDPDPDSALIGLHLRDVATRSDVCDALRRREVTYVVTGDVSYRLNLGDRTTGMTDLAGVSGFTQVAQSGRYTLFRIDACGFGTDPTTGDAPSLGSIGSAG